MQKRTPALLLIAAFIILIAALMYAQSFINPLLMAFFISIICAQPIVWLKKKKVPDGLAILIVLLGIVVIYIGFIELIGASLSLFISDTPKYEDNFREILGSMHKMLHENGINISAMGASGSMDPSKALQYTRKLFGKLSDVLSNEITFLFLTIFLLTEVKSIALKIKVIAKSTNVTTDYLKSIGDRIRHYLSIKTMTSLVTGILVGASLALIGVDYPILWGLVAFLLNYIPTIGSIIAAIPGVLFSIIELGFPMSFITIGVYVVVNVVIGNVLEPKIMGKGLGLSTFIVFFGLIFWGFVLGPVGMFLSVPLMIVIKLALNNKPKTKWIAALLGTETDAELLLKDNNSSE